jgi:hypothetical protein
VTAGALLRDLSRCGVRLEAQGPDLVVDGPAEALPDLLIEQLRALKAELLTLLATKLPGELWDTNDWHAYVDERAAIREHDGGLLREQAERLAAEDAVTHWLCLHPAPASDSGCECIHCGLADQPGNTLLPMLAPGGHLWVHDRCWESWHTARRNQARKALETLGLSPPARELPHRFRHAP